MADNDKDKSLGWSLPITVAFIGLIGTTSAALISNWDKIFSKKIETLPSSSPSPQNIDWLASAVGRYDSKVEYSQTIVPVVTKGDGVTEFRLNSPGILTGSYELGKPESNGGLPHISGTLSQCEPKEPRQLRCRWEDTRGTGNLEISFSFSENLNSFEGYWNLAGSTEKHSWRGFGTFKVR
jgi:hypothetical protein